MPRSSRGAEHDECEVDARDRGDGEVTAADGDDERGDREEGPIARVM
jgi:hypothetical protein